MIYLHPGRGICTPPTYGCTPSGCWVAPHLHPRESKNAPHQNVRCTPAYSILLNLYIIPRKPSFRKKRWFSFLGSLSIWGSLSIGFGSLWFFVNSWGKDLVMELITKSPTLRLQKNSTFSKNL